MSIKKSCDVVVIGAGIGGLTLAARLAHAGYKAIVLEKTPLLGGRYTYVDYKGYWVPTGAVVLMWGKGDPVLKTLGFKRVLEYLPYAIGYGVDKPEFWIGLPHNQQPATVGNGTHIAFTAKSPKAVDPYSS